MVRRPIASRIFGVVDWSAQMYPLIRAKALSRTKTSDRCLKAEDSEADAGRGQFQQVPKLVAPPDYRLDGITPDCILTEILLDPLDCLK